MDAYDGNARYDLMLTLFDDPDGLRGSLEYDADLFDPPPPGACASCFLLQAAAATADPDLPPLGPAGAPAAARHQVARQWNDTPPVLPAGDDPRALRRAGRAARRRRSP